MSSFLVECRNKTETDSKPGDWTTTIQDKIFLEDGDSIIMNKAFIDTNQTQTSQLVIGPEGETLTLEHIHYQFNNDLAHGYRCGEGSTWVYKHEQVVGDADFTKPPDSLPGMLGDWAIGNQAQVDSWGNPTGTTFGGVTPNEPKTSTDQTQGACSPGSFYSDGNMYIDCDMAPGKPTSDIGTLEPFYLFQKYTADAVPGGQVIIQYPSVVDSPPGSGQYPAKLYQYPIPAGTKIIRIPASFNYHIFPDRLPGDYVQIYIRGPDGAQGFLMENQTIDGVTTYSKLNTVQNLTLDPSFYNGLVYTPAQLNFPYGSVWSVISPNGGTNVYEPHVYTTQLFIPGGNYDPSYLAQFITDGLAKIGPDPTLGNLTNNNFLVNIPTDSTQTWVNCVSTKDHWNDFTRTPSSNALDFRYRYGKVGNPSPIPSAAFLKEKKITAGDFAGIYAEWQAGVLGYWNMGNLTADGDGVPGVDNYQGIAVGFTGPEMTNGSLSGTNQVSLKFNTETNNFYWEYLHMPFYDSGNEVAGYANVYNSPEWGSLYGQEGPPNGYPAPSAGVPFVSTSSMTRSNQRITTIGATGGILFSGLSSRKGPINGSGEQTTFWTDKMGFETDPTKESCILVSWHHETNKPPGEAAFPPFSVIGDRPMVQKAVFNTNASMPDGVPVSGRHYTEGYLGLASTTIVKDMPTYDTLGWFVAGQIPPAQSEPWSKGVGARGCATLPVPLARSLTETSGKTIVIDANDGVVSKTSSLAFGYYLIEVESNFQNNFLTPDSNRRSTMAICSRYYERATYTSATESDSIVYTHRGAPALLSSFSCRILDSDKNIALNLGEDNTVFLQVVKAPKNLEYLPGQNPFDQQKAIQSSENKNKNEVMPRRA